MIFCVKTGKDDTQITTSLKTANLVAGVQVTLTCRGV